MLVFQNMNKRQLFSVFINSSKAMTFVIQNSATVGVFLFIQSKDVLTSSKDGNLIPFFLTV